MNKQRLELENVMWYERREIRQEGLDCRSIEGNQCRLSYHDLCYKQHWNEIKAYKKCICRHCAVCGLVLRKEVVGDCSICNANMHLECARKLDFYCIGCLSHHAVWPL